MRRDNLNWLINDSYATLRTDFRRYILCEICRHKISYFAIIFHLRETAPQALASLTKLLEYNNITIVAQELLGESKEEIHESPIKILKVRSTG